MEFLQETSAFLAELNPITMAVRICLAALAGGLVGLERGFHGRAAGLRTHMLVCLGAALSALIGCYLSVALGGTDVQRTGAQVMSGVGFLGAGTILLKKGNSQITGLTTAAGLWASACMGLAIGAGFYLGALVGCLLIILTTTILSYFEGAIMSTARNMNIYIEFESTNDIGAVIESLKATNVKIYDVEITKLRASDGLLPNAILSIRIPKKLKHADVMTQISAISGVHAVEEL